MHLFERTSVRDESLGVLTRTGGCWHGVVIVSPDASYRLRIAGGRRGPDPASLALARELGTRFAAMRAQLQDQLFAHYAVYREAAYAGKLPKRSTPFPQIAGASFVWRYVSLEHVLVGPLAGAALPDPIVEVACRVDWDEEHMLGGRFQRWRFVELCGSI